MNMIPFRVDPSWYERYWWSDPPPERTGRRVYRASRERLLRAADAMKGAINPLVKIVLAALKPRLDARREASPAQPGSMSARKTKAVTNRVGFREDVKVG